MTSLTDYIRINHHLMTVAEMAEETGAKDGAIRHIMKNNNWVVLSPADRVKDYIKAHCGATVEDIAEHLNLGVAYVRNLASEIGIDLITRKQAQMRDRDKPYRDTRRFSLMHRAFHDSEVRRVTDEPVKRVSEGYNQSGSPYGLADEVWNKKLK